MIELVFKPEPDSTTHGHLCIRFTDSHLEHPILTRAYWPASDRVSLTAVLDHFPELAEGPIPLRPGYRPAVYVYSRNMRERDIHIIGGNEARALYVDEERIEQPKVRRGIQTRYMMGRWEKYLKTQGWTAA